MHALTDSIELLKQEKKHVINVFQFLKNYSPFGNMKTCSSDFDNNCVPRA